MANKIQFKRGVKANLPTLNLAEPAFTTDTNELFVGNGTTNIKLAKQTDLDTASNKIGVLTSLTTTDKDSLVDAINENTASLSDKANNTDSARTTTAKDVTGAINELNAKKANKYDGGITNFNTALTHGKYTFSNTVTNGYKLWYGEVDVIVSDGGTHNNSSNWIWQVAYYTDGTIAYRSKSNSEAWSSWKLLATTEYTTITLINGWIVFDANSGAVLSKSGKNVTINMHIKGGNTASGTVICNVGYTFNYYQNFLVYSWNGTIIGSLTLQKNGDISVTSLSANDDIFVNITNTCI